LSQTKRLHLSLEPLLSKSEGLHPPQKFLLSLFQGFQVFGQCMMLVTNGEHPANDLSQILPYLKHAGRKFFLLRDNELHLSIEVFHNSGFSHTHGVLSSFARLTKSEMFTCYEQVWPLTFAPWRDGLPSPSLNDLYQAFRPRSREFPLAPEGRNVCSRRRQRLLAPGGAEGL
jgi:hypothetical protein